MLIHSLRRHFLGAFGIVVMVLALVRCAFPRVAGSLAEGVAETPSDTTSSLPSALSYASGGVVSQDVAAPSPDVAASPSSDVVELPFAKHKIYSVPSFRTAFPDSNAVQLEAARRWGVKPVRSREDAGQRMNELVFMGASPFYQVDRLASSVPYLVPRASLLLSDIGRAFFDSLYVKGIPLHKMIVTSVLRTEDDVVRLRRRNGNATENSCHLYATTFDISYTRFRAVESPRRPKRRLVSNDTLKWVLSEVLRDKREEGRCYVKYEVKQSCFHLTTR